MKKQQKQTRGLKRAFAWLLALAVCIALFPGRAAAADVGITVSTTHPLVGTAIVITCTPAEASYSCVWYAGSTVVGTGTSYTPTGADVGKLLHATLTFTGSYAGSTEVSMTDTVKRGLETIGLSTGSPTVGTAVSASVEPAAATVAYQWYRVDTSNTAAVIVGATGKSYTPVTADIGYRLRVGITGTGDYLGAGSSTTPNAVAGTRITGGQLNRETPLVGEPMVMTLEPAGATADVVWYADGVQVGTGLTYTPKASDVGKTLQVKVTGTGNYSGGLSATVPNPVAIQLTNVQYSPKIPSVGTAVTATISPAGATAAYQWYRLDTAGNAAAIAGATSSSYTPVDSDVGYRLKVTVTATGNYVGSNTYEWEQPVAGRQLTSITISNKTPSVGNAVTASVGPAGATADFVWYAGDVQVGTGSKYTPTAADVGKLLKVQATGTGTYSGSLSVSAASPVKIPLTGLTIKPSAMQVGQAAVATLAPAGATAEIVWYADGVQVGTGSSYTPAAGDAGKTITVIATGTGNYLGTASGSLGTVAGEKLTGVTLSTATPAVGTAVSAVLAPTGAKASYQWYRVTGGVETAIAGATKASYTPTAEDMGYYLRVKATGTGGYTGTVTATSTARVPTVTLTPLNAVTLSTNTPEAGKAISAALTPAGATASYQWYRVKDGAAQAISGATAATYTPSLADVGYTLRVNATGTGAYTGTVTTATTGKVTTVTSPLTGVSLDTDTPRVGEKVTAALSPAGATAEIVWYVDGVQVETGSTYVPVAADAGKTLSVAATGTGAYTGTKTAAAASKIAVEMEGEMHITPDAGKDCVVVRGTWAGQHKKALEILDDAGKNMNDGTLVWSVVSGSAAKYGFSDNCVKVAADGTVTVLKSGICEIQAVSGGRNASIVVVVPGDYNRDGKVNTADVTAAIDVSLKDVELDTRPYAQELLDIIGYNGAINTADVTVLVDVSMGDQTIE